MFLVQGQLKTKKATWNESLKTKQIVVLIQMNNTVGPTCLVMCSYQTKCYYMSTQFFLLASPKDYGKILYFKRSSKLILSFMQFHIRALLLWDSSCGDTSLSFCFYNQMMMLWKHLKFRYSIDFFIFQWMMIHSYWTSNWLF